MWKKDSLLVNNKILGIVVAYGEIPNMYASIRPQNKQVFLRASIYWPITMAFFYYKGCEHYQRF
jgi:hypothetical protein